MIKSAHTPIFAPRIRKGVVVVGRTPPTPANDIPVACFTWSDIYLEVDFDAGCSTDDGTIVAWAWDFGDTNTSTTGPTVTHTYAAAGTYDVELVVTDDLGADSVVFTDSVTVAAFPTTWTLRTTPTGGVSGQSSWTSVCWSPELDLYAACAEAGDSNSRIMTSPDGVTWTMRTCGGNLQAITWSSTVGAFCAVGVGTDTVFTSTDGTTWTQRTKASSSDRDVIWVASLGLFIVCGPAGTAAVMTSPTGVTWTNRTVTSAFNEWQSLAWSPSLSLLVAVASTGTDRVMTSPNAVTWTNRTAAAANQWTGVAWSPTLALFCAVSSDGTDRVMTSPDGITWTSRSASSANAWRDITWSPELGLFVAVASSGTGDRAMQSADGINWVDQISAANETWRAVEWSPDLMQFAAVGSSGSSRAMTLP